MQPAIADVQFLLNEWFDDVDEDEPVISREVGIVLASAHSSQEVTTTTVLWLNEFYGTDIRCVRLPPYRPEGRLLLDIQQVSPKIYEPNVSPFRIKVAKRVAAWNRAGLPGDWAVPAGSGPDPQRGGAGVLYCRAVRAICAPNARYRASLG